MRKSGFTLIELVMVIVIIGILAAVAIPKFMDLQTEAKKARCQADIGAIRTGITGWYAKYHANNSTCPVGSACVTTEPGKGFPLASALNVSGGFGGFAFSEGIMPPVAHIMNLTACPDWGAGGCYSPTTGVLNMTAFCESE